MIRWHFLYYLLLWALWFVPPARSSGMERWWQHPKMHVAQTDAAIVNEYIVILRSEKTNMFNSSSTDFRLRGNSSTAQQQSVPSNWVLVELTEEELANVLDDDKVAFVEQVREWMCSWRARMCSDLLPDAYVCILIFF